MARSPAVRSLTRPRAVSPTPSASDQIAAANAKLESVKANPGTTATARRAARESFVDPRILSPGERLIVRQQQEILQRMGIIQSQNTKILERLGSVDVKLDVHGPISEDDVAEGVVKVSEPDDTVEVGPVPVADDPDETGPVPSTDDPPSAA